MAKLMRSPYTVRLDRLTVDDVTEIIYVDKRLKVKFLPTDFKVSNHIATGRIWQEVVVVSCNGVGITYHLKHKEPRIGITIEDGVTYYTLIFYVNKPVIGVLDAKA